MKRAKASGGQDPVRLTNVQGLIESGLASEADRAALQKTAEAFSIGLSPHLVKLIQGGKTAIARQYVPDAAELRTSPGEYSDPIGDAAHSPVKGIVHRYPDRVLLKAVNVCAVYCRFCFRRELIGPGSESLSEFELEQAFKYIRETPAIWEVILTGGDPLVLSPVRLQKILLRLNAIPHVRIVRIHTRIPVADPQRMTPALYDALKSCGKPLYIALHVNHPDEITPEVEAVIRMLHARRCTLLAQSVLLRGINNDPAVLAALYRKLVEVQVRPYELHHPDRARGTSHFRLSLEEGRKIYGALRGHVSGLCLPHYMLDLPGGHGKVAIAPETIRKLDDGGYEIQDFQGNVHTYRDEK